MLNAVVAKRNSISINLFRLYVTGNNINRVCINAFIKPFTAVCAEPFLIVSTSLNTVKELCNVRIKATRCVRDNANVSNVVNLNTSKLLI